MFDKLAAKAGEIQHSVALNIYNHVSNSIIGIFPFTGTAYSNMANAVVDDLKKIIERSFSVSEVREIVTKYEAEIQKKLLVIRNYMSEEQKKNDKIADLEKQLREAKDEIVALKQQIEIQVNNQQLQAQVQIPPKNNN
jgi:TolA-binding protein